ncbi:MAG: methyl-accepting chemotaxis protein [Clostridiales bacterium]|jgi:methyl-accepting chemotaxis protein|nr:methyl-accepting chemotaxis protein [Clostridiales bacterium]
MKWYGNLKIGAKLALGFGLVLVLLVGVVSFSVYTASTIDADYSYMDEYPLARRAFWLRIQSDFHAIRRSVSHSGFLLDTPNHESNVIAMQQAHDTDYADAFAAIEGLRASINSDPRLSPDEKTAMLELVENVNEDLANWKTVMTGPVIQAFLANDRNLALDIFANNQTVVAGVLEEIGTAYNEAADSATTLSAQITANSQQSIIIMVVFSVAALIIGVLLAIVTTRGMTNPIRRLMDVVRDVAAGMLNVNIDREKISKDEIGTLTCEIVTLIDTILLIVSELDRMSNDMMVLGDIDARADASRFSGSYKEVVEGVNGMMKGVIGDTLALMGCLDEFGKGNFKADVDKLPGKKAVVNQRVDAMRSNLTNIAGEINGLVHAASSGKLNSRVDVAKYSGDWAALLESLNALMQEIANPINEASDVMKYVAAGVFDHHMQGNYHGDFLSIKTSINDTVAAIAGYINEISDLLGKIADGDLRVSIRRDYVGQFNAIKESINTISSTLNKTMAEISSASEQVLAGAKQISVSSMTLAEGASEQASAVQELTASMESINEQTQKNATDADEANVLSVESNTNAQNGSSEMTNMLTAMDAIKDSSASISKVIKAISDIAFQTNLLALNASVEAARAGEHGKGFAVVADEVRSLASKSQESANDTATLIENSNTRVNDGTKIAQGTANALRAIVEDVAKISVIIKTIADSSRSQAEAIGQVSIGLNQISQVVQNNSSTSEESAAAAQELSSQAELLQQMVSYFKI